MDKKYTLLVVALVFILIGVIGITFTRYYSSYPGRTGFSYSKMTKYTRYSSSGERIFYTGVSKRGAIPFRGGPMWLRRHGGGCASCHGDDGHGGLPIMMSSEVAPDITYKALIKGEAEKGEAPYTDKLIKRAITQGLDSEGKPLDWTMPRWEMNRQDLNDVVSFLKTL